MYSFFYWNPEESVLTRSEEFFNVTYEDTSARGGRNQEVHSALRRQLSSEF